MIITGRLKANIAHDMTETSRELTILKAKSKILKIKRMRINEKIERHKTRILNLENEFWA
jgi:hypothetical protein